MRKIATWILAVSVTSSLATGTALAAIPSLISYQGVLTDDAGNLVADGNYDLTFRVYAVSAGGAPLWSETQTAVPVSRGGLSVLLGSVVTIGGLAFDADYWLGISVNGGAELAPRVRLATSPYAFNALRLQLPFAATAASASTLFAITNASSGSAIFGQTNGAVANSYSIRGSLGGAVGNGSAALRGEGSLGNPNTIGVWGYHPTSGTGVFGQSITGIGVSGTTSGGGVAGVLGQSTNAASAGVRALNTNVTGTALEIQQGAIQVTGAGVGSSTPVFIHAVTGANRYQINATAIDNPLCNGNSSALLFVQSVRDPTTGEQYQQPVIVMWNVGGGPANRWSILGPAGTTMTIGTHFSVLVVRP